MRNPNTTKAGNQWTDFVKFALWNTARRIPNESPMEFRQDKCGNLMQYSEFGNRESANGWEIDHIKPVVSGGEDDFFNLQPLHWKMNDQKGDLLVWNCPVPIKNYTR
jgi:5-methylcytosine-specific restriction endonuclease McrA